VLRFNSRGGKFRACNSGGVGVCRKERTQDHREDNCLRKGLAPPEICGRGGIFNERIVLNKRGKFIGGAYLIFYRKRRLRGGGGEDGMGLEQCLGLA